MAVEERSLHSAQFVNQKNEPFTVTIRGRCAHKSFQHGDSSGTERPNKQVRAVNNLATFKVGYVRELGTRPAAIRTE